MDVPLQLSFKNVEKTPALDDLVREKVDKLESLSSSLTSCRVHVEREHESQTTGNGYHLRIEMHAAPGHVLLVEDTPGEGSVNDELSSVLIDAFQTATRRPKEHEERNHGEVKTHPQQEVGAVVRNLFAEEGYGFAESLQGETVYFHRNSVINDDWDRLQEGSGVRLVVTEGDKGPQATTVQVIENPSL